MANMHGSIPRIDFAGIIDLAALPPPAAPPPPGADHLRPRWAAVRAAVMDALRAHGCFEAVVDGLISPELRAAVLGPGGAAESVLSLPASAKARGNDPGEGKPYHGYVGGIPGLPYESVAISDPLSPTAVRAFAARVWPAAAAAFPEEAVVAYAGRLAAVEAAARRMVLESVGATASSAGAVEAQAAATAFKLRLSEYAAPGGGEDARLGLPAHRDTSFLAVVTQNGVDGVEVECGRGDGGWARPTLSPSSFLVFSGDTLKALTNGQVYNPLHRVVVSGDEARYSAILFSLPVDGAAVRPLDEAVDGDHPAMYRPFDYGEYAVFCYLPENMTPEVMKHAHKLEAFAAVRTTTTASSSAP